MKAQLFKVTLLVAFIGAIGSSLSGSETRLYSRIIESNGARLGTTTSTLTLDGAHRTQEILGKLDFTPIGEPEMLYIASRIDCQGTEVHRVEHWLISGSERWHLQAHRENEKEYWVGASKADPAGDGDLGTIEALHTAGAGNPISNEEAFAATTQWFAGEKSVGEDLVARASFDVLDVELADYLWNLEPWKGKTKVRVFMTDKLERESIKIACVGNEVLKTAAGEFSCRVFDLKNRGRSARYWLADQGAFGAIIVREAGNNEGHDYISTINELQ